MMRLSIARSASILEVLFHFPGVVRRGTVASEKGYRKRHTHCFPAVRNCWCWRHVATSAGNSLDGSRCSLASIVKTLSRRFIKQGATPSRGSRFVE